MADVQGPVYRGQQITLSAVVSVMTFFGGTFTKSLEPLFNANLRCCCAVVAMGLRIAGRYLVVRKLGNDDWLMLAGTV